jgi:hypothetical protein
MIRLGATELRLETLDKFEQDPSPRHTASPKCSQPFTYAVRALELAPFEFSRNIYSTFCLVCSWL